MISGSDKEGWAIYLERGLLARKIKVVFYAFIFVFKNLGRLQRFLGGAVIGNLILNSPTRRQAPLCVQPLDAVP